MTMEKVIEEIISSAKAEERKIISEAEKQAKAVSDGAENEANAEIKAEGKKTEKLVEELKRKKVSSVKVELKKKLMNEKKKILEQVIEAAKQKIDAMPAEKRKKILKAIVEKAKKELPNSKYFYSNKADKQLLEGFSGLSFDGEVKTSGGIIITNADKSIRVDYTFERLLENIREEALDDIAKNLFGE